jgi:hypothetical protein
MSKFFVNKNLTTQRVVLSEKLADPKTEITIKEVTGRDYVEAREKLRVDHVETYTHRYGHGYFDD